MKMNLKLTADELQNVVDAIMNEATDRGYDPDDEETVDDMLHIVDAALSAMGIDISEDESDEDDFEDEDDWDEDDEENLNPIEEIVFIKDGKRTISQANATMLLNMVAERVMCDDRVPADRKWEVTQGVFLAFAKDHGLECVEMDGE